MAFYTTNFPAAEDPISQGGIWIGGATVGLDWLDMKTSINQAYANAFDPDGVTDALAQLKRTYKAFAQNHYSEGTVFVTYGGGGPPSVTHEIEVFCNMTITAHSVTGYECYVNFFNNHTLVRWNGAHNDFTPLASNNVSSFTAPVEGDVIRIQRMSNGTTINCYQNGILRTTADDTTYLGGNPGIGNNPVAPATLNGIGWKLWTASDGLADGQPIGRGML